ncbi:MAG TPA: TRAP transporter substrate-binding protein [Syntrophorhabdales bacterium]|nr:TRAP transporter substrate-binding protein [Syntrophorhabdales bacterium]
MKRVAVFVLAVTLMLVTGLSVTFAAEPIKLKYGQYFATTHKNAVLSGQFCEEIKKRTNGRVEITHYPGGTLTTAPKMFQAVVTDICDLGWGAIAYNQGRFPVLEAADLPLGRSDGWVATQVADDYYRKFMPKEWDSVHVLFFSATGPNIVYTTKTQVKTLEDMKGVKLRGIGKMADTLRALGAAPIPLEIVDLYEAMRRGVLEGAMLPLETLKGFKVGELAKYVTGSWKVGATNTFYAVMNKEKWDSLPADIKKIFDEVSMEFKAKQAMAWNELDYEGATFFKQYGGQIIQLSDAEARRWQKAVEPVIASYKKDVLAKGFKSEEVDGWISYIRERVEFWEKKGKEQHVQSPFE